MMKTKKSIITIYTPTLYNVICFHKPPTEVQHTQVMPNAQPQEQ